MLLAGTVVGLAACSDGGSGPSPASLTGTWSATKADFVNITNASEKVELIAHGGSVTLVLNENKSWTMTIGVPGEADRVQTGTWSSSIDELTLSYASPLVGEMQFDMSLSGSTLSLAGGHCPFDVNGDTLYEESTLALTMTKQ